MFAKTQPIRKLDKQQTAKFLSDNQYVKTTTKDKSLTGDYQNGKLYARIQRSIKAGYYLVSIGISEG